MVFIELYTAKGCSLCDNAKKILNDNHHSFQEYQIGVDIAREKVKAMFPQVRLLPVIVVDGRVVENVNEFQMLNEGSDGVQV